MAQTIDNMVATWNNGATTFTALKFNITDTASNASSLLMDLQVGGVSQVSVRKDGYLLVSSTAGLKAQGGSILNFYSSSLSSPSLVNTSTSLRLRSDTGSYMIGAFDDAVISRRAAANLRFGAADAAAPVAQTLSVQSVVAGTTNTAGTALTITGSQGTGTGVGGSIIFQVAPAGSTGTAQNALANYLVINPTKGGTTSTGSNVTLELAADRNGAEQTGFGTPYSGQLFCYAQGRPISRSLNGMFQVPPTAEIGWNSAADFLGNSDVRLFRDAANTLALRNGANAQGFNIYNTYTDASNYELGRLLWSGNSLLIQTLSAGTGSVRSIIVQSGSGNLFLSNTHFLFSIDNDKDIGASGANRPRRVYVGSDIRAPLVYFGAGLSNLSGSSNNALLQDASGSNFAGVFQFGGTTSSFPAIKRSSTTLQARLADDTGFASVQGKLTTETAYTAGAPTATGYLVVYDSAGTAYKIPAVAV